MTGDRTRVDPHVKVLDEQVVSHAIDAGLDVLVYAPHFTHIDDARERAARFSTDELLVVPGREYFTGHWSNRTHVLAVDPEEPLPDFLPLHSTMTELRDRNATVIAPHPEFLTVSLSGAEIAAYDDVIDAVEVRNPKLWPWDRRRARAIAADVDLPTVASSYAHLPGTIGAAWVEFERSIDSAAELRAAIEEGPSSIGHRTGARAWGRRRLEFAHLGWENSVKKADRILLGGREDTHPENDRYDDHYRKLSVY
ncbi:PHP-associated domain-containing protein [Halococcoides cellulosivorans]|uniref:Metal-dependent phosphoesterase n=1 Tax=Halococcoides cellulosivorans TaxID=1679096 RepID=A0A2R4WXG2_9EURY|nr:PHP-associated domain-containing protein [Halococcoides cellulosivorans]AWB26234.1 metal-dependent phosphoesterase [Halococcoides cellulosivorans]